MADMGVRNSPWNFASQVFVFFDNGDRISGTYDGYGRVDNFELIELSERRWRMVIQKYYDGETFEQLPVNKFDPGQGWFYNDEDLEEIFKE